MREDYALRYLQRVVNWDESKLANEVGWLRRIAAYKYDSYQDFFAGERFISALIRWLCQFAQNDRDYAYDLLKNHLIFLSAGEMSHLVGRTVPAHFHQIWLRRVAEELKVPDFRVMATPNGVEAYRRLVRSSLFIGLSDGARIDILRRANVGFISNEQFLVNYEISSSKLSSMLRELQKEDGCSNAKFGMVFLIDDFLGSGTTLCRKEEGRWKGKIEKFGEGIRETCDQCFSDSFQIVAHHYVATEFGTENAANNLRQFKNETTNKYLVRKDVILTNDLILRNNNRFPKGANPKMDEFLSRYYDSGIMTSSLWKGGCEVHNGFADCGLVLILEHNTPNNSLAILWADSIKGASPHRMRSLFPRRQRHG